MKLFRNESSYDKTNAQINLDGLTHYVDSDSLRFHKSRINTCVITDNGLLLSIIESYAVDMHNTSRLFRPVIFDICGNVIYRPDLDNGFKTGKQAIADMWVELDKIDAVQAAKDAIDKHLAYEHRQADYMLEDIRKLIDKAA